MLWHTTGLGVALAITGNMDLATGSLSDIRLSRNPTPHPGDYAKAIDNRRKGLSARALIMKHSASHRIQKCIDLYKANKPYDRLK